MDDDLETYAYGIVNLATREPVWGATHRREYATLKAAEYWYKCLGYGVVDGKYRIVRLCYGPA